MATWRKVDDANRIKPIPLAMRSPMPAVGSTVEITRPIRTCGRTVSAGSCVVSGGGYDAYGDLHVNLSRGGIVVANGVEWPRDERPQTDVQRERVSGFESAIKSPPISVPPVKLEQLRDVPSRDEVRAVSGNEVSTGLNHCGIVACIDFMNLLVRAFFAGAPSEVHAVRSMLDTVRSIIENLCPEFVLFAGEGGYSERAKLFPAYKSTRPPKPPELISQIRVAEEALESIGWPLIRVKGWEADDVLASLATQLATKAAGVYVVSSDKDLLQLLSVKSGDGVTPLVYHPWDGGKRFNRSAVVEKFGVTPEQLGDYLALTGDGTDDIPGVKGIGEKSAAALLGQFGDLTTILEKARCLMIPGANGKRLREQADIARLSRRLVELQRHIPIPNDWQDWPVQEPRVNWLNRLQTLGLGSVGQRLADKIPIVGTARDGMASIWIEWTNEPPAMKGEVPNSPPLESTPLARAMATDFTDPNWTVGFPVIRDFGAGTPREIILRSIYADELQRRSKATEPIENGYRRGTDCHFVTELAMSGAPFQMPQIDPKVISTPAPSSTAVDPSPVKQPQKSLF